MLLAVVLLVACTLGAVAGSILYTRHRVDGVYDDVQSTINDFFSNGADNTPSRFDQTIDSVAKTVGDRFQTQMEARLMATKSHEARAENLLSQDVVTDLASQQNPLLGIALEALPSVKKRLAKNPTALAVLLPMLEKFKAGGNSGHTSSKPGDVAKRIKGGT